MSGNNTEKPDKSGDYKLERYKYILQQLHSLNENNHKYLSLYQALVTAVIGGGIAIFVGWKELKIDAATARVGIRGLLGLLVILTLFVCILIIVGIFSWFDYRREEVKLLKQEVDSSFRQKPKLGNIWRWSETYLILFIIVMMVIIYIFVEWRLIPLIY
jgi:hypothetical protein